MKYLKRFNESNISPDYSIVAPIRLDIEDRLDEFKFGYDFKFVHYDMRTTFPITSSGVLPVGNHSENNFQFQILPKGYPNSKDIDPVLINISILGDLMGVISFIEDEIKFKYSHSYYFVEHKYDKMNSDIFTSEGKLVTMIQMFFTGPDDLSYLNEAGYSKKDCDNLIFKFSDSDLIENNYSQSMQDIFVLSMLNGKKNGFYIEIGANNPVWINNTYLLESKFGWSGISFDINSDEVSNFNSFRNNKCICADASKFDYKFLFDYTNSPKQIDYLQVDCHPPDTTLECLLKYSIYSFFK